MNRFKATQQEAASTPFWYFILHQYSQRVIIIGVLSLVSGVAMGLLVPLFLHVAHIIQSGVSLTGYMISAPIITVTFLVSRYFAQYQTAILAEEIYEVLTVRVCNRIRQAELTEVEQLQSSDVYDKLISNQRISEFAISGIDIMQFLISAGVCWVYFFSLTRIGAIVLLLFVLATIMLHEAFQTIQAPHIRKERRNQQKMFIIFNHFLFGFRELKLDRLKSDDLYHCYLAPLVKTMREYHSRTTGFFLVHFRANRINYRLLLAL
ncbi:MAG: hypothetical protein D3916_02070, partial [Candidatus Electrothrix sp. MAN1_4]|nr:hypothetical protein [Candidatus Electrothrix sp. MAN1_4]